jgi:hypothetical protein
MPPIPPALCRVAVCRELLNDDHEWSIYVVNDQARPIEAVIEQIIYEWGDVGQSEAPEKRVAVGPRGSARIWRVDDSAAELSVSLSLRLVGADQESRLTFELGKLYLHRNPTHISELNKLGWIKLAEGHDGS